MGIWRRMIILVFLKMFPQKSLILYLFLSLNLSVLCAEAMIGNLNLPLLCPNGHPCCSSCASRVRSSCPTCRTSITSWTRCLFLERVGTYLVERSIVPEIKEQIVEPDRRKENRSEDINRRRIDIPPISMQLFNLMLAISACYLYYCLFEL